MYMSIEGESDFMNLDQAVGRLFLIGLPGKEMDSETRRYLKI